MPAPRATPGNGAPHRNDTDPGEQLLEVAAEHATRRVPTARPEQSAGEVRDGIVGSSFESAVDVAVLDGESLVGIVSIETLLAADRDARIESVMDADPPVVEPGVDQEVAAWVMCRRGEASLGGRFRRPVRWADPAGSNAQGPAHRARRGSGSHGRLHGGHRARAECGRRVGDAPPLPPAAVAAAGAGRGNGLGAARRCLRGATRQEGPAGVLRPGGRLHGGRSWHPDGDRSHPRALRRGHGSRGRPPRADNRRRHWHGRRCRLRSVCARRLGRRRRRSGGRSGSVRELLDRDARRNGPAVALSQFGEDPAFGSGPLATVLQDLLSIVVYLAIATPLAT